PRLRRRRRRRSAHVSRGSDAVRRREGLRQHARGARIRRPRDDRGTPRRGSTLTKGAIPGLMIRVGIALLVVGFVLLFVVPWVGGPGRRVGRVLVVLWLAGWGRSGARGERPVGRRFC